MDDSYAVYYGPCISLGIGNGSFLEAVKNRPTDGLGARFEAWVMPKNSPRITHVGWDD